MVVANASIAGITSDFEPPVLDLELLDEVVLVDPDTAAVRARELALTEGLWVGPSSGAVLEAASAEARGKSGRVVVAVLADTGRNITGNQP